MKLSRYARKILNIFKFWIIYRKNFIYPNFYLFNVSQTDLVKVRRVLFYFNNTEYMHLGDHLFFLPLVKTFIDSGYEIEVAPTKVMQQLFIELNIPTIRENIVFESYDLIISRVEMAKSLVQYRSLLVDITKNLSKPICDQLLTEFTPLFHLLPYKPLDFSIFKSESILEKFNLPVTDKFILFNLYCDSSSYLVTSQKKLTLLGIIDNFVKLNGYKIILVGSQADKAGDDYKYDFDYIDLRGQTSVIDIFNLVGHQNILHYVGFDAFVMHVFSLLHKGSFVVFRGRISYIQHVMLEKYHVRLFETDAFVTVIPVDNSLLIEQIRTLSGYFLRSGKSIQLKTLENKSSALSICAKDNAHKISLFIPTRNASRANPMFRQTLSVIKSANLFQVLIIDSSSEDDTLSIVNEFGFMVRVIAKADFDHGATRQQAAEILSESDYVIYLTQDVIFYDSTAIINLTRYIIDHDLASAYGRQIAYPFAKLLARHMRQFNYGSKSYIRTIKDRRKYGIKCAFASDSFAIYKISALKSVGGFPKNVLFGEDTYTYCQLLINGYKVGYCATAICWHSHDYSIKQDFKRYFDIGVFHSAFRLLIDEFGYPYGEGKNFVMSEVIYFLRHNWLYLPIAITHDIAKYAGYRLGFNYQKLSYAKCQRYSMHPHSKFWEVR